MAQRKTKARIGYGTTISYSALDVDQNPTGAYTLIGEIVDVNGPQIEADVIDATHTESPNTFEEMIAGLGKAGSLDIKVNYNGADTAAVYALFQLRKSWKVSLPDGATWVCNGFLNKLGQTTPVKGKIDQDWSIKLTAYPTFTAGS